MTQYLSPGAFGQFAVGQGSSGEAVAVNAVLALTPIAATVTLYDVSFTLNGVSRKTLGLTTAAVAVSLHPMAFAYTPTNHYTLSLAPLAVAVTTGEMGFHASNVQMPLDMLSVTVTLHPITLATPELEVCADVLGMTDIAAATVGVVQTDGIALQDAVVGSLIRDATVVDKVTVQSSLAATAIYTLAQADALQITETVNTAWPVTLLDAVTLDSALTCDLGVALLDSLVLSDPVSVNAVYNLEIVQKLMVLSSLGHFFGGDIADVITLTDGVGLDCRLFGSLSDALVISSVLENSLFIRVDLKDGITVNDDTLLSMIYEGTLSDDITVTALYAEPEGVFTTWAVNTRTNNVTEYRNWAFNSFAKLDGRFIGASADGIYELEGADDDGTPIAAAIRSGLFQPSGSHLLAMKCAYIGMAINDPTASVFLKLITGDGLEFVYRVNATNRRSTRVEFGKGLRSRYYSWELVTTGADFDLDTVEFVPLVARRRV